MTERDHYKDLGVDVRIILKRNFKNTIEGMDWIDLSQVRTSGGL